MSFHDTFPTYICIIYIDKKKNVFTCLFTSYIWDFFCLFVFFKGKIGVPIRMSHFLCHCLDLKYVKQWWKPSCCHRNAGLKRQAQPYLHRGQVLIDFSIRRRGTLLYCVVTHRAGVCFLHRSTCLPYLFTGSLLYNRLCEQVTDGARMPKRSQSKWQETSLFTTTSNVVQERRYCRSMPNQPWETKCFLNEQQPWIGLIVCVMFSPPIGRTSLLRHLI